MWGSFITGAYSVPSVAVVPALGIGDALLMMIASHQLRSHGYTVTTFHNSLPEFAPWFPGHSLQQLPSEVKRLETFASYDLILVENDNSPLIKQLTERFRQKLSIFYPSYRPTKHAPLSSSDRVFDSDLPMAGNIAIAVASLINEETRISKENGLTPPLIRCLKKEQILIHPTSRMPSKNWKAKGFIKVATGLKERGFDPLFCVSPSELKAWKFVEKFGFSLATTPTLSSLATVVYESLAVIGNDSLTGHLASNLGIPTLVIANDEKRMRLWQPGWLKGQLVLPPAYLPNWKILRLKERHWQSFISPAKVLRAFDQMCSML